MIEVGVAGLFGVLIGWFCGYNLAAYPTETNMLASIIELHSNRAIRARSKTEVNRVIKKAIEELNKE
jgi:hypothetical protein